MNFKIFTAGVSAAMVLAGGASAATVFSYAGPTAEQASPGSIPVTFSAGAGAGLATFRIDGYNTLDGYNNCCTDTFTLSVNGTPVFSGSWDLGGGGSNVVLFAPAGATATPYTPGFGQGGYVDVSVPLALLGGSNTLTFAYNGASQGLGDEGWGLQNITVTGAGVPEPATWTLMLLGVGFAGVGLRSAARRRATAA